MISDHPAGQDRARFSFASSQSATQTMNKPAGIPETRFHFKTEVLRFGRVGNNYARNRADFTQFTSALQSGFL